MSFQLVSDFRPAGDQPAAIEKLSSGLERRERFQTLLGVTGSGKTYTMASVIERLGRPALVLSHNKTLAAQLYGEFKAFFPHNHVAYFVSYYDYYQPEAYLPASDTFIEKDASINEDIDRLRLYAASSVLAHRDTIVVATVSCIYPSGTPEDCLALTVNLAVGQPAEQRGLLRRLVEIQYERSRFDLSRGTFRVRGNRVEIIPSSEERALRVEISGGRVSRLAWFDYLTGRETREEREVFIYPAKQYVTTRPKIERGLETIAAELAARLAVLEKEGRVLEARRLEQRTRRDMEMIRELGYCNGVENYSRHFDGRGPGERPRCLLDFFPPDFLLFVDESHISLPQVRGMFFGDRSRKETLVEYGFRLPSALDNRPQRWKEFRRFMNRVVFVSATPGAYELRLSGARRIGEEAGRVAEQIIRPTGLLDPPMEVRPTDGQVDDLIAETRSNAAAGRRTLVLTLSKNMAEELSAYLSRLGVKVEYIHYEVDTFRRVEILRQLREARYDVLVGINLLREGLDLPEVSLVIILDADKSGFLRSETSLLQIAGRAARSLEGRVILYADRETPAMRAALGETARRRAVQAAWNRLHGVTPRAVSKKIYRGIEEVLADKPAGPALEDAAAGLADRDLAAAVRRLEKAMFRASRELDFERAARLRDRIRELRGDKEIELAGNRQKRAPGRSRPR